MLKERPWYEVNTLNKLDERNETWEEKRDREVLEYFKSIPCITKKTKDGTSILPDDMR